MEESILIKYFNGEATQQEKVEILAWVEESEENAKYFSRLSDIWFLAQTSGMKSDSDSFKSLRSSIKAQKPVKAPNINKDKTRPVWRALYFGAAAVVACLLIVNIFYKNDSGANAGTGNLSDLTQFSPNVHTIYTPKGTKAYITLPDSSKVKLNSDTRITFPDKFTGQERDVLIDGEAFFDVTKDSLRPMIISTSKNYTIKVLGTKFNVYSYSDDAFSRTTLIDGKVEINDGQLLSELSVGESYVKKDTPQCEVQEYQSIKDEVAWTQDRLIFNNTPMSDVIKRLERWHGATIIVKNPAVFSIKMTAEYENESLVQILEVIKFSTGVVYSISDNTVYLDIE